MIDGITTLEREMRQFVSGTPQPLVLGATVTVGNYILAPLLSQFEATSSHGDIDVRVDNPSRLVGLLRSREASIVLDSRVPKDDDLDAAPFADDHLALIVPATGHRFSTRRTVRAIDLADQIFVGREADSPTRQLAERELSARGVHVHTLSSLGSSSNGSWCRNACTPSR